MANLITDGDAQFLRVDNRRPAHALEPGVVAEAVNLAFDRGQARTRPGVNCQRWGQSQVNLVPTDRAISVDGSEDLPGVTAGYAAIPGLIVGQTYLFLPGNMTSLSTEIVDSATTIHAAAGTVYTRATRFVATQTTYYLLVLNSPGVVPTAWVMRAPRPCGYGRFNDPGGFDNAVLVTDEDRTAEGEDGGKGKAWRILPGNVPQEIPLNGHDIWDTARLIQCLNGLVLLRQGDERHYVPASAFDLDANTIQLNCAPAWLTGDIVEIFAADPGSGIFSGDASRPDLTVSGLTMGHTGYNGDYVWSAADQRWNGPSGAYIRWDGDLNVWRLEEDGTEDPGNPDYSGTGTHPWTAVWSPGLQPDTPVVVAAFTTINAPNLAAPYYVRNEDGNGLVTIYTTRSGAISGGATGQLGWARVEGRFYLQRANNPPGPFGNGAPGLLLQGSLTQSPFEVGFAAATRDVVIAAVADNVFTAHNHRFIPGDHVAFTGVSWTGSPDEAQLYVAPQSDHEFRVYSSAEDALVDDGSTNLVEVASVSSATCKKLGAAGLPLPPGREGAYINQRLLIVNGKNNVLISDPLDPLHYALYAGINANLGEADQTNALVAMGNDTVVVVKENVVLAFTGLSGASSGWALQEITREYGGQAALLALRVGADVWFGSRHGVASVAQTEAGQTQGVALPVSEAIANRFPSVDWRWVAQACGAVWNNRVFCAYPLKGATSFAGRPENNGLFVYNTLNGGWEDLWSGDALTPVVFCRLTIAGEERLTFVNAWGIVGWFGDGFNDFTGSIATRLVSRGYFGLARVLARSAETDWDTASAQLTVKVRAPGWAEEYTAGTYTPDRTKSLRDGQSDYNPATGTAAEFRTSGREDYTRSARETLFGPGDIHQNTRVPWRFRVRDRSPQIIIENAHGSARVNGIAVTATAIDSVSTKES